MKSNIGDALHTAFEIDFDLDWQMSRAEKYCLIELLRTINPEVSIEIGTFKGGSLQVISKYSKTVYSIDISEAPKKFLEKKFSNVDFKVGNSHKLITEVLSKIENTGQALEFVLIDGDHSKMAVRQDIMSILDYNHKNTLHILLHDSFNPQCRKGIRSIDYKKFKNVKYVELDYIGGAYWHNDTFKEMWGGFALIIVDPKHYEGADVTASLNNMYKKLYWRSIHLLKDPLKFLVPLKQKLFKRLKIKQHIEMYERFD